MDQTITRLRRVLEDHDKAKPRSYRYIDTVHGDGYVFKHGITVSYEAHPEALLDYYEGLEWLNDREPDAAQKAAECFERVLKRERTFARAHAARADCYAIAASYAWMPLAKALEKAKAAAHKALTFDATLAQPHATLGFVSSLFERDFASGEREFTKARSSTRTTGSSSSRWKPTGRR